MPPHAQRRWPPERRVVLARWLDMLACGVVAGSAVLVLLAVLGRPLRALLDATLDPWTPHTSGVLLLAGSVLAMALLWRHGTGRWRAMLGWRYRCAYPGVAAAAAFGLMCVVPTLLFTGPAFWGSDVTGVATPPLWAWVAAVIVLVVPPIAEKMARKRRERADEAKRDARKNERREEIDALPRDMAEWTFEQWLTWAGSDDEVRFREDDQFDAAPIADRIARRLREDHQPSIALIGPRGSGKSSIVEMVAENLREHGDIEIIRVSLWPFDSPEAAMRGILGQLIDRIGRHAPVLGLTGLPSKYLAAVDHMAGRWGVLRLLATPETDPAKLVGQIERLAETIGVRFVLAIEDFERFRDGHADAASLAPVRALLYLLDQCKWVTVVMASDDLDDRFDMEKIVRYVERVPRIATARTATMLDHFRIACIKFEPDELPILDPWKHQRDEELFQRIVISDDMLESIGQFRPPSLARAVACLASTPRSLKSAVRSACDTWAALPGEIDIDDLVVLSVFKEAEPSAYAYVTSSEHIAAFQQAFRMEKSTGRRNQSDHPTHRKFMVLLDKLQDTDRRQAVWSVVAYLFPGVDPIMGDVAREARAMDPKIPTHHQLSQWVHNKPKGPQTVAREWPVDYLRRFDALAMDAGQPRDQDALRALDTWAAGDTQPLLGLLFDPKAWPIVERFGPRLTPAQQLTLLQHVVDRALEVGWNATESAYAPGLSPLVKMFRLQPPDSGALANVLCQVMPKMVRGNIQLAMMVEQLFASPVIPQVHRDFIGSAERQRVRLAAVAAFQKAFLPDRFGRFEAAMASATPNSLKRFCWTSWRVQPETPLSGVPWDDWSVTANFLLDYARHDRDQARIIIAPFVARAEKGDWQWTGEFKADIAQRLFDIDRLAALYRGAQVPDDLEEQPRLCIQAAIDWANAQPDPHPDEPSE